MDDPYWDTLSIHVNDKSLNKDFATHTWKLENLPAGSSYRFRSSSFSLSQFHSELFVSFKLGRISTKQRKVLKMNGAMSLLPVVWNCMDISRKRQQILKAQQTFLDWMTAALYSPISTIWIEEVKLDVPTLTL